MIQNKSSCKVKNLLCVYKKKKNDCLRLHLSCVALQENQPHYSSKLKSNLSRLCLLSSPEMRYINVKDEANASSVLFSGKKKTASLNTFLLTALDHVGTVHSECSALFLRVLRCLRWTIHRIYFKDIFLTNSYCSNLQMYNLFINISISSFSAKIYTLYIRIKKTLTQELA